ncbi:MAG: flavodoxin domain-containing protein [Candidatus Kariarchaeaceae archaeon]|jgi:menaquinone-dependent protoporphyrinogen oxidase
MESKNKQKILVTYDGKFGSTGEVANFISQILTEEDKIVEMKKISDDHDLTSYDGVVIGCPIHYDKWNSSGRKFVKNNEEILSKIPVAFFFTCLVLSQNTEKANQKALGYSNKLYDLSSKVQPITIGQFAGVLDYSKMSFILKIIVKTIFRFIGVKEGDYRDWDLIRSWAKNIDF